MSADVVQSLTQRLLSLEDIIRQQEHTIGAVLQRLRDVEQYAAAESRNREQAQQQLYALLGERGGATAEAASRVQEVLQNHNDRLSALQAEVQGQGAALRGVNDKHDVALRGMEQRIQADVGGVHQRAQTGEAASADAMRALQSQLQALAASTQAVEARGREDVVALQQHMSSELAAHRQRSDNLESAIRDALRDVHGSLTGDVRSAGAQQRGDLDGAVQRINQALEALDQRTRIDMNQLHSTEQADVNDLRRRIEEVERNTREVMQAMASGLAGEVTQVAQHSQALDKRQATAHQAILQELAKHDAQLESVDLSWRASVTDLSAKARDDLAAAQQRSAAADQALQSQIAAVQERLTAAVDALRHEATTLAASVQESCVRPVQEVHRIVSAQEQRVSRVAGELAAMQENQKSFSTRVDADAAQFRHVVEAAVRASHSDLLERIHHSSAAAVAHQDSSDVVRAEVSRGLAKLWEDAQHVFLTQRSLNDVQTQLATLESAVRVELCALAERHSDVWRAVDAVRIAQMRAAKEPVTAEVPAGQTSSPSAAPAAPAAAPASRTRAEVLAPTPATQAASDKRTAPLAGSGTAAGTAGARPTAGARASATSMPPSRVRPGAAAVEEIDKDVEEQNERLRRQEEDIRHLRSSLQRLRIAQAQEYSKGATTPPPPTLSRSASAANLSAVAAATAATAAQVAQADDAASEARSAAREAAESAKAAEVAQDESVRAANAMRLALTRVEMLEESLQRQLEELRMAHATTAIAAPPPREHSRTQSAHTSPPPAPTPHLQSAQASRLLSRPASQLRMQRDPPPPGDTGGSDGARDGAAVATTATTTAAVAPAGSSVITSAPARSVSFRMLVAHEEEEARRAEREERGRVSNAAASLMSLSPHKPSSGVLRASASEDAVAAPAETLVEVPGMSTGEVFLVRQDKADPASSPVSVRVRPISDAVAATAGAVVVDNHTPSAAVAATPNALFVSTPADSVMSPPSPRRGSTMSEVLLPTHQFVRKREYNNFKDFTKQEIDAIWVELLHVRRSHGLSKEEVLLYVSQSKEQMLATVLKIVQQQEKEMLGMLATIKTQLADLHHSPSAMREIRVFPVDHGRHLEEFMRALASGYPQALPTGATPAPAPATTAWSPPRGGAAPPTRTTTTATAMSRPASHGPAAPRPVASAAATRTPPTESPIQTPRGERSGRDTAFSSARSTATTPLQPQFIAPVVQRRASQPTIRPEPQEVLYATVDAMNPPHLYSAPQREPPRNLTTQQAVAVAPQQTRQFATAALVHPLATAPASHPPEPGSVSSQYRPTSMTAVASAPGSPGGASQMSPASFADARPPPPAAAGGGVVAGAPAAAGRRVSPHAARSAPAQRLLPSPSNPSARGRAGDDATRYLKEAKSPRNSVGSSFHLNPLVGIGAANRSPPRAEPGVRRAATASVAAAPVTAAVVPLRDGGATRPMDAAPPPPHYRLVHDSPPSRSTSPTTELDVGPQTDTSPGRYQPATISQDSEIHYQSVEKMRPSRSAVRRSSADSMERAPLHHDTSPQRAREPGHLYERHTPMGRQPSVRVMSAPTQEPAAQPRTQRPRQSQLPSPHQTHAPSLLFPPATPHPQPRDAASSAARRGNSPLRRAASVHVLPSSSTIHLGPYAAPTMEDGTHAYASGGGRGGGGSGSARDAYHTPTASRVSVSPDRHRASPQTPGDVVPVRVLDGPASRAEDSSRLDHSSVIRIHPYHDS
ncbi:hypothetical protein NESM_000095700 [Novymonas esmeraldas]|uniref:Uncharacterized protein n=1 Tax=Novymonas esmeraldas TaxID=1808958 RepID=A0AAW0F598_9TRYP